MLQDAQTLHVVVKQIDTITPTVKRFTLVATDGAFLPAFSGGSHILVHMKAGEQRIANAYSLMNSPSHSDQYQIGVLREVPSKGGSAHMHDHVRVGDVLEISAPKNLFGLAYNAHRHLLIAGGIGITPILSQIEELAARQADYQLHYAFHSQERGAFVEQLRTGIHHTRSTLYSSEEGQRLDLDGLLSGVTPHTHVYVCGPTRLTDAVKATAKKIGIDARQIHVEQFAAITADDSASDNFVVHLHRSGTDVVVQPGTTILAALEKAGVSDVPFLCRSGVCGTCETTIIAGQAEHCDQYLTPEEKAANKTLLVCVSRARGAKIVLDL